MIFDQKQNTLYYMATQAPVAFINSRYYYGQMQKKVQIIHKKKVNRRVK